MTERKRLKKELAKLKLVRNGLPMLMDCSIVYGDGFYSADFLSKINAQIEEIETKIAEITSLQVDSIKPQIY